MATAMEIPEHARGVKLLADAGVKVLPSAYIRPNGQRSADALLGDEELPIIDLSQPRDVLIRKVGQICKQWGFFQVINHGVPKGVIDKMFSVIREFHALPIEEKMKYYAEGSRARVRYGTSFNVKSDMVLNWRDYLRHDCAPFDELRDLLPDNPPSYRETVEQYTINVRKLGLFLIELISESLGLGPEYISKVLGTSEIMACNFYPPCPQPELALGLPPHTDPGTLTLLQQDGVGGLQVKHDGKWINVVPIPYAFITNVADQIQILTNNRYKSIEHRVVLKDSVSRVSIPYVFGPHWDNVVQPAAQLLEQDNATPAYKPVKYADFVDAVQGGSLDRKLQYMKTLKFAA